MANELPFTSLSAPSFAEDDARRLEAIIQPPSEEVTDFLVAPITPLRQALRRFSRNKLAMVSLIVLTLLLVSTIIAQWLPLIDPTIPDAANTDAWPSSLHLLGTDSNGHDLLSSMIFGLRPAFIVGITGAVITTILGVTIGLTAGFRGGWIDTILSRFTD